jgi:hypothetical protein
VQFTFKNGADCVSCSCEAEVCESVLRSNPNHRQSCTFHPRAHAQRAAAATHTPLELHAGSSSAAASQTLPTKSNGRGARVCGKPQAFLCVSGCAAEPDYGGLERYTQPLGFVSCGTHYCVDDTHTGTLSSVSLVNGHCTDLLYRVSATFFSFFIPRATRWQTMRASGCCSRPCTACSLRPVGDAALPLLPQPPQRCHGVPGTQGSAGNSEMLARTREAHDNGTVFFGILDTSICTLR